MNTKRPFAVEREDMPLATDYGRWVPLRQLDENDPGVQQIKDQHEKHGLPTTIDVWSNDVYEVYAFEYGPGLIHLSIKRFDRRPIRNWRHFQQIKNEVVGPESEGVELFPAESRLVDNANQYHLWCIRNPDPAGTYGQLENDETGETYDDVLVVPRNPDALDRLALGYPEGMVSDDAAVDAFNAQDHRGRQEPWQPGLTTGRNAASRLGDENGDPRDPIDTAVDAQESAGDDERPEGDS